MLATVVTMLAGRPQIQQFEAPTVKDCLVAWAGKVAGDGPDLTDEARTRLRGDMADFDAPPLAGFENVWKLEPVLGGSRATVIVTETARR